MAQYDVYVNPRKASREFMPYVVDVQSDLLSQIPSRLIAPLSRLNLDTKLPANLCPKFLIQQESLVLRSFELAPISARQLGNPVCSISAFSSEIVSAIDAVISGI